MPQESQEVLENFASSLQTMILGKCQGGDALLKKINKGSKSLLKMAGEEQWYLKSSDCMLFET